MSVITEHIPSDDQIVAIDLFDQWLNYGTEREFRLGGTAGTGKTWTLAKIVSMLAGTEFEVIAPTAKAAEVLNRKGIKAKTCHSLLCNFEHETEVKGRIVPVFSDKEITRKLILCDEASMITSEMRDKILACADRVVWVGDYGQLPPVEPGERGFGRLKGGVLTEESLDAKLTTQHRHGEALQIVLFADFLRGGGKPEKFDAAGTARTLGCPQNVFINRMGVRGVKGVCEWAVANNVWPLICYTNNMIARLNQKIRKIQGGHPDRVLYPGLKLACTYNSYRYNVANGELFEVKHCGKDASPGIWHVETTEGRHFPVTFDTKNNGGAVRVMDGYAITCHKSQGSEWPKVAVIEEMTADKLWRYTGATRAQKQVDYFTKGAV